MAETNIYSVMGNAAPLYDIALRASGYEKSVHFFISQLPFTEDTSIRVLDAGCGSGLYSLEILRRYKNAQITAFDIDKGFVDHLREKLAHKGLISRAEVFIGDITSDLAQLQNKSFDLVLTAGVLEYTPLKETVANLARFVVTGGYWFNSPIRTTVWGHIVARLYGCVPHRRQEYFAAAEPFFKVEKIIPLPPYRLSSFKEGQLFKKIAN